MSINRTGKEGGTTFWGNSFIAGPFGEILQESDESEGFITAEIDLQRLNEQRETWPFFRDRRIDAYGDITKRFIDSSNEIIR